MSRPNAQKILQGRITRINGNCPIKFVLRLCPFLVLHINGRQSDPRNHAVWMKPFRGGENLLVAKPILIPVKNKISVPHQHDTCRRPQKRFAATGQSKRRVRQNRQKSEGRKIHKSFGHYCSGGQREIGYEQIREEEESNSDS